MRDSMSIAITARSLRTAGRLRGVSWTLTELCEHLALAYEISVSSTAEPAPSSRQSLPWTTRVTRWAIKHVMLATGWFPRGVTAPAAVEPQGGMDLEHALVRLERAAAAFDRKLSTPGSTWGCHSILGPMSGPMWKRFHDIHGAHHFSRFQPAAAPPSAAVQPGASALTPTGMTAAG